MTHGKLYLEEEPPNWLQNMDDIARPRARDQLVKETGENHFCGILHIKAHYYVYFGVVPVLLFYLPFYLLRERISHGDGSAHRHGVFVAGLSALLSTVLPVTTSNA